LVRNHIFGVAIATPFFLYSVNLARGKAMSDENKIRDAADAVKGVVEAVPVYQDVAQPALQQFGKGLETVAKLVHVALAPVSMVVWGYEQIRNYLQETLTEKLKKVPPEQIVSPKMTIAGPIVEQLRFAADEPSLRELYANLLATSMDARTAQEAHPAFVEIIRQLSTDEARLLSYMSLKDGFEYYPLISARIDFKLSPSHTEERILMHLSLLVKLADCAYPHLWYIYLDNLKRLGLLEISSGIESLNLPFPSEEQAKDTVLKTAKILFGNKVLPEVENVMIYDDREYLSFSSLGSQFRKACIYEVQSL
jgi:hypothetical protein